MNSATTCSGELPAAAAASVIVESVGAAAAVGLSVGAVGPEQLLNTKPVAASATDRRNEKSCENDIVKEDERQSR